MGPPVGLCLKWPAAASAVERDAGRPRIFLAEMADAVAIVSVLTTGAVGLSGVVSGVWGAAKARAWQGREERISELRGVLDTAAGHLSGAIQAIAKANEDLRTAGFNQDDAKLYEGYRERARERLADAEIAQFGIWSTHARLRVRRSSDSTLATTLLDAEREVGFLGAIVKSKLANPEKLGYDEAWAKAAAAERAFYDAAADELRPK